MIAQTIKSDMERAIQRARREGSIVIVNFHWGVEQSTVVTSRQQDLANFAIESGADIIMGHHPHVLQPVEERIVIRKGVKCKCVIAWSLGNFVFDGHKEAEKQSMILEIALGNEGVRGFRILPIVIEHSRPKLASGTTPSH